MSEKWPIKNSSMPEQNMEDEFKMQHKDEESKNQENAVITNSELGISYKETIINLPLHRQKEVGIKRIRRKEILSHPDNLRGKYSGYGMGRVDGYSLEVKNWPIYDYLTDGRFTSFKTLNHQMFADVTAKRREQLLEKFNKETLYFQKCERSLDVSYGPSTWSADGNLDVPVFFFGNKNKTFVNYLETMFNNNDVVHYLTKEIPGAWSIGDLKLIEDRNSWLYFRIIGPNGVGRPDFKYNPDKTSPKTKEIIKLLEEKNVKVFESKLGKTLDVFRLLLNGESFYSGDGHTSIPKLSNANANMPDLRWCHSEFAIIPTRNSLNVLFFET